MHRDKGGAAAVASFFYALTKMKPADIRVIGGMAMVRNSVGSEAYLADEIITSRAGVRVRVGNTDAEGRMAMVDVLWSVLYTFSLINCPLATLRKRPSMRNWLTQRFTRLRRSPDTLALQLAITLPLSPTDHTVAKIFT